MIRSKAFFKRTRRGKVLRVVEEHYLRDDVGVGSLRGQTLSAADMLELVGRKGGARKLVSVLDTNVALNQIDFLENKDGAGCLGVVVLLQTVVEETRKNSLQAYRRLKKLLMDESAAFVFLANQHNAETFVEREADEGPNDYNDRAIRVATSWLQSQLGEGAVVMLHTYDRANMEKAKKEGIRAGTLNAFVEQTRPELADMLAVPSDESLMYSGLGGAGGAKSVDTPPEHLPLNDVLNGIKAGRLFQGTIRVERDSWWECYVTVRPPGDEVDRMMIAIRGAVNVNRAIDGDVVAVEVLPREKWLGAQAAQAEVMEVDGGSEAVDGDGKPGEDRSGSSVGDDAYEQVVPAKTAEPLMSDLTNVKAGSLRPTGRVVGIVRRNWRVYCGTLEAAADKLAGGGSSTSALFVPVEKRIPKVRIQTRQREALENKRILVAVDAWPVTSRYPVGHYVKTLGAVGDKAVETEVILHEFDIPWEPFSDKVMACLPPSDWKITPENSIGRRDLRHLPVMSIDPPGCKDIDDALHCVRLPNGNLQVGVHIADVTYFVSSGSALDDEAANRSTSTYLVQKRLDMLPKVLTETLCSLTDKEPHFAFSVIWEMSPNAEIINVEFCKSIIHSIASLSYNQAQVIHDDKAQDDAQARGIRDLNKLAKKLRRKRMEMGALLLASPEVKFVLDDASQDPLDVQMYQLKETHALVEEFMLLANITVGKKILRHFPTLSLLRRHPAPSRERFEPFIAAAASRGFDINVDDSSSLQKSLDAAEDPRDPYLNKVIRIMATRCMFPAQYFCSGEVPQDDWHHYGLAAPIYTHFTSPIRRYADVVVHRLLGAAIGVSSLPEQLADKGGLHDLAENMNRRHRAAQMAGRSSTGFHTVLYFRNNPVTETGYILRLMESRIAVLVPKFGIEGTVSLKALADAGELKRDADGHTMHGPKGQKVRVFDRVKVHIKVEGKAAHRDAVVYTLVEPPWSEGDSQAKQTDGDTRKRKSGS